MFLTRLFMDTNITHLLESHYNPINSIRFVKFGNKEKQAKQKSLNHSKPCVYFISFTLLVNPKTQGTGWKLSLFLHFTIDICSWLQYKWCNVNMHYYVILINSSHTFSGIVQEAFRTIISCLKRIYLQVEMRTKITFNWKQKQSGLFLYIFYGAIYELCDSIFTNFSTHCSNLRIMKENISPRNYLLLSTIIGVSYNMLMIWNWALSQY